MTMKKIERVVELTKSIGESRKHTFVYLFMGWGCVILAPSFYFFSVWDILEKIYSSLALFIFGVCTLGLGYREKKETEILEKKLNKLVKK